MIIYTANKKEVKILEITNIEQTKLVIYINDIIFDDVMLIAGDIDNPNLRVLELELNENDTVSIKDNNLVKYTI